MAWDTTKSAGNTILSADWNAMVTDQKTRLVNGAAIGTTTLMPWFAQLTTIQRNALTPQNGMIIYNTTTAQMEQYAAGAWSAMGVSNHASLSNLNWAAAGHTIDTSLNIGANAIIGSGSGFTLGSTTSVPKLISVTTTQRDALTPAVGMLIYNSTTAQFEKYEGTAWTSTNAPFTVILLMLVPETDLTFTNIDTTYINVDTRYDLDFDFNYVKYNWCRVHSTANGNETGTKGTRVIKTAGAVELAKREWTASGLNADVGPWTAISETAAAQTLRLQIRGASATEDITLKQISVEFKI